MNFYSVRNDIIELCLAVQTEAWAVHSVSIESGVAGSNVLTRCQEEKGSYRGKTVRTVMGDVSNTYLTRYSAYSFLFLSRISEFMFGGNLNNILFLILFKGLSCMLSCSEFSNPGIAMTTTKPKNGLTLS